MAVEYHKLHGPNEIQGSLLFKYKMAKALTLVSLAAIVMMALYSLFNPSKKQNISLNIKYIQNTLSSS
jgi:hypothetical protein